MAFKVAVVFFSRRGRLVVLANVIAAGARQVGLSFGCCMAQYCKQRYRQHNQGYFGMVLRVN